MRRWIPSERQITLLNLVKEARLTPTYRELSQQLGVCVGTVVSDVEQLVADGHLRREPRKARAISVAEAKR